MKIAIHLSHPSQYYVFRSIARALPSRHEIVVVYNRKDVLERLGYRLEPTETTAPVVGLSRGPG